MYDVPNYPRFMCWTGIWVAIFHWAAAIFDACDYMRYVTDFSSESFGIAKDLSIKGIEELVNEFQAYENAAGYLSCVIVILHFATIYGLEWLGRSTIWKPWFRGILADYAYVIGTLFWVDFAHIPGNLKATNVSKVPVARAFHPTQPHSWLIGFWILDVKWVFVALYFGLLVMLLFYYDHNISSLTAQARHFPLKNPRGFHWDLYVPVHTDSLTVNETEQKIISTAEGEGSEIRRPIVNAAAVVEQRVSHFLMGLVLIGFRNYSFQLENEE